MKLLMIFNLSTFILLSYSCTKKHTTTQQETETPSNINETINPRVKPEAILNIYLNSSKLSAITLIETSLGSLKKDGDYELKAKYYNLLSYIYKSDLNYVLFKKYNELALSSHKMESQEKITDPAILLNTVKSNYEFGDFKAAEKLLSNYIDLEKISCEAQDIERTGFLYLEYAYMLALRNETEKAQVIVQKCSKNILSITHIPEKFKKNVYFYTSLINALSRKMNIYEEQMKKYEEHTPKTITSDIFAIKISNICSYYINKDFQQASKMLHLFQAKISEHQESIDITNFIKIKEELQNLVDKKSKSIPISFGHWHFFCQIRP